MNHTLLSIAAVFAAAIIGLVDPLVVAFCMSAFWVGREIAQAEYRVIEASPSRRRADLSSTAIFTRAAWTRKALLDDLTIPTMAAVGLALAMNYSL